MFSQSPDDLDNHDMPFFFGPAEDWHFNACMPGMNFWDKWIAYIHGFKLAADLMVKLILEGRSEAVVDTLVIPIVFNYRQYIELNLKQLIISLDMINHKPYKILNNHNLTDLWNEARGGLKMAKITKPRKSFDIITSILSEFMKHDPGSFSFRYPVNTKGEMILEDLKHINVRQFYDAIQRLDDALQTIEYQVGYYLDASSKDR